MQFRFFLGFHSDRLTFGKNWYQLQPEQIPTPIRFRNCEPNLHLTFFVASGLQCAHCSAYIYRENYFGSKKGTLLWNPTEGAF